MTEILYRSTNNKSKPVRFKEAILKGQAPDYGLYMPAFIPKLTRDELKSFKNKKYHEIASIILKKFLENEIEAEELDKFAEDSYNFEVPIEKTGKNIFLMRLDRGPTASFKDFAARMMARLMRHFAEEEKKDLSVLAATSGDTGSAVASAFSDMENVKVIILFPEKEVSLTQRKQMTTLGKNIKVFAVRGTFDDCQSLVKRAFNDGDLKKLNLTSANSINFGRLLPQTIYYFYAYSRLNAKKIIFSVPSGNFGNLVAGVIGREMGLPAEKFIVAVNENDEFPRFLETGIYKPVQPSKKCSSNAMNVGHPSNLARLIDLYGGQLYDERNSKGEITKKGILNKLPDMERLRKDFASYSITDGEVNATIKKFYSRYKKLLEPHGAVAWNALERYMKQNKENKSSAAVCFETADPAKFPEKIKKILGVEPKIPKSMSGLQNKKENFEVISNDYFKFKEMLLK